MRADRYLVERGLASSRTQAQEFIDSGRALLIEKGREAKIKKASQEIPDGAEVKLTATDSPQFVSRGGVKLYGALKRTNLNPVGMFVLDVGLSTGGFSDCLLQAGAKKIIGVDVGHKQLAFKLQNDPRLISLEGINARELKKSGLEAHTAGQKFDLIVIDVSFISLSLVLPEIIHYLNESGRLLALVKPQFEVGRENLGKGGIVKDPQLFSSVQTKITTLCRELGLTVDDYFESPIEGSDGNKEFFIYAHK